MVLSHRFERGDPSKQRWKVIKEKVVCRNSAHKQRGVLPFLRWSLGLILFLFHIERGLLHGCWVANLPKRTESFVSCVYGWYVLKAWETGLSLYCSGDPQRFSSDRCFSFGITTFLPPPVWPSGLDLGQSFHIKRHIVKHFLFLISLHGLKLLIIFVFLHQKMWADSPGGRGRLLVPCDHSFSASQCTGLSVSGQTRGGGSSGLHLVSVQEEAVWERVSAETLLDGASGGGPTGRTHRGLFLFCYHQRLICDRAALGVPDLPPPHRRL